MISIKKLLLTISIITITNYSLGQFYVGVKEVDPYLSKLSKLDIYLQISPDNLYNLYDELYSIARRKNNKTLEAVLNIYKGTGYYYSGQSDSSVMYFDKSIALANKIGNKKLLSTARIRKIFVIGESTDNKVAYQLMKDEYDRALAIKDTLNMIYALNGMTIFGKHDQDDSGYNANMKAINLARDSGFDYEYGFLLNNLGVTKLEFGEQKSAIKDFVKGLEIAKLVENPRLELTIMENFGYYYMEVDSIELAKNKFIEVYDRAIGIKHYQVAVTSMINLGGLYRQEGDFRKSDSLITEGLRLSKKSNMFNLVSLIYLSRAQLDLEVGNYAKVNRYLDSAKVYGKYTPSNDIRKGIYQINYLMNKKKGNFEEALSYYQQLKNFEDSINDNGRLQMITELQLKYDVEKKEKEKVEQKIIYEEKLAKEELNTAQLRERIAGGVILTILLLSALIIYYLKSIQRRESEFSSALVNKLEEERGRIALDLHDGIGQSLILLKNKFNKIEGGANELSEELNVNFSDTIEEVRSISRSLIPPELRRLGLRKSLNKMLKDVEQFAGIVVTVEIEDLDKIKLEKPQEIRIYRIIQEFTNNTTKHSEATSLKVEIKDNISWFSIIYQDNGKGLDMEKLDLNVDTIGLRSIRQRLKFLKGTIRFEKPLVGFKAIIKIKK